MNEEALKDAYNLFVGTGYNGTVEDFSELINTNEEALSDAHKLFVETGYNGSIEDFSGLVKKKDQAQPSTESVSEDGSSDYGERPDGTQKGTGFLGVQKTADGKDATELSIGVEIDGEETLIPTLVPTLSEEEKDWLLQGGDPTKKGDPMADGIVGKAVDFATERKKAGKPLFAEEGVDKFTLPEDFGQNLADPLQDFDQKKIVQVFGPEVAKKQQEQRIEQDVKKKANQQLYKSIEETDEAVIDGSVKAIKENRTRLENDYIMPLQTELERKHKAITEMREAMGEEFTTEQAEEYNALVSDFHANAEEFEPFIEEYRNTLIAETESLNARQIKRSMKGNFVGAVARSFVTGTGEVLEGATRFVVNAALSSQPGISPVLEPLKQKVEDDFTSNITKTIETVATISALLRPGVIENTMLETTPEFVAKKSEEFLYGAVLGVARSAPAMLTGVAGLVAQASDMGYKSIRDSDVDNDLSYDEKVAYGAATGIVMGVLENFGLQTLMNKGFAAKVINKAFDDIVRSGQKVNTNTLTRALTAAIQPIARGGVSEGLTGTTQEIAMVLSELTLNTIKDKEIFEEQSFSEYARRIAIAGAQEMIGGIIMSSPASVIRGLQAANKSNYEAAESALQENGFQDIVEYVKAKQELGEITQEEGDQIIKETREFAETANMIPSELPVESRLEAFKLIREKQQLEAEIEGKDPALVQAKIDRIKGKKNKDGTTTDGINQQLEKLSSGETVVATQEVSPQPAETAQEVRVEPETEYQMYERALKEDPNNIVSIIIQGGDQFTSVPDAINMLSEADVSKINPDNIVRAYDKELSEPTNLNAIEAAIANSISNKMSRKSFVNFADESLIGESLAKSYGLTKDGGKTLDQVAQEASMELFGFEGVSDQITPNDVSDFMLRFNNGYSNTPANNDVLAALNETHQKVVGKNLNKRTVKLKLEKIKSAEQIEKARQIELTQQELAFVSENEVQLAQDYDAWIQTLSEEDLQKIANYEPTQDTKGESRTDVQNQEDVADEQTTTTERAQETVAEKPIGTKPEIKMTFPTNIQLRSTKNIEGAVAERNRIKESYKEIKSVLDCLWKTIS